MKVELKSRIMKFLLLTFGISWFCWGVIVIANGFGVLLFGEPLTMLLYVIGGNGAPIASYILLKRWGQVKGFKDFVKQTFRFKSKIMNYGLVLFLLSVHFVVPLVLGATNGTMALYFVLVLIPFNFVGGGFEEIGWRGILQPYLEKSMSFFRATVLVAVIWTIWHLPLWFIAGTFQSTISFTMFSVSVLGMSFTLGLLRRLTENVFLCILLHSCMNSLWTVLMPTQDLSTVITMVIEIILVMAILTYVSFREKKGTELYAEGDR